MQKKNSSVKLRLINYNRVAVKKIRVGYMQSFNENQWALILGGSSGFGLASAKKLSSLGMSVCVVHRDRKGAMPRIEEEFDHIRKNGHPFISFNEDALDPLSQTKIINLLAEKIQQTASVRMVLHSIALGNLKPVAPVAQNASHGKTLTSLANRLQIEESHLEQAIASLFSEDSPELYALIAPKYSDALIEDEDVARTVYSMGTSMLTWTQKLFHKNLFAKDARVLGLTSEGNEVAWRGYAAVSAAKVALESISRSIATEFAPYGIRSNVIQAGVTDTQALRAIPGNERMKALAKLRNPFKRLTTPEDVANVVAMLSMDEAAWINGTIIRVDGGEHITSF